MLDKLLLKFGSFFSIGDDLTILSKTIVVELNDASSRCVWRRDPFFSSGLDAVAIFSKNKKNFKMSLEPWNKTMLTLGVSAHYNNTMKGNVV